MRLKDKIYLDYQSSTPVGRANSETMLSYFTEEFGNPHSSDHAFGWAAAKAVERSSEAIALMINADSEEVVFTSGATESNNHIIHAVCANRNARRNKILVSAIEHKCVLNAAEAAAKLFDMSVVAVPVRPDGLIDIAQYKALLGDDVALVAIMAVNNEIGTIQPVAELTSLAHEVGALFLCDGAQAPAAVMVDVNAWGVDFLSLSAHKIYGPKGIGALYVRKELLGDLLPLIHGGGQQDGLRGGTVPTPLCVGFGLSASAVVEKGATERAKLAALKAYFLSLMKSKALNFSMNGAQGDFCHPGNMSVRFHGVDAHSLLTKLQPWLCASTGSACSSGFINQSHVLRAIGLSTDEAASTVRFSIGRYSDNSQMQDAVDRIHSAIQALQVS